MNDKLQIDVGAIIGLQPETKQSAETKPYYASHFLAFADTDYILFRVLALADSQREAMFHLNQMTEKYLKAIVLASGSRFDRRRGHDLEHLLRIAVAAYPVLGDKSMALWCHRLEPYQQWGHYPEMILDQAYLTPNWNHHVRHGLSEADLVAGTLREAAAIALDAAPYAISAGSRPWVLEELVHRDAVMEQPDTARDGAQAALREMLLLDNMFFTPEHLPTNQQSLHEHKRYPMIRLPREHPNARTRLGLPPTP